MVYLAKCVDVLDKARRNYSESQYKTFREALLDEHKIMMLEIDTDLDILSKQE